MFIKTQWQAGDRDAGGNLDIDGKCRLKMIDVCWLDCSGDAEGVYRSLEFIPLWEFSRRDLLNFYVLVSIIKNLLNFV